MADWILFAGGIAFLILSALSYWKPDTVWRLYNLEPRWRDENPERTPAWDAKVKRYASYYLLAGVFFILLAFTLGG